jgi:hypothetical protein
MAQSRGRGDPGEDRTTTTDAAAGMMTEVAEKTTITNGNLFLPTGAFRRFSGGTAAPANPCWGRFVWESLALLA